MHYDVLIIGGGLVGAGLAVALRSSGLRIALVDAKLPSNDDPRLIALNNCSCQFLKNINVWPQIAPHASHIQQVHVSHQGRFGAIRLHSKDMPNLGHVIPAYILESVLNAELEQSSNCTLYRPARLQSLTQMNGFAKLRLDTVDDEKEVQADIVIGADGTESTVRKQLNIQTTIVDYQQSALVTRTILQRAHSNSAYERFHKKGAIAMLPLLGNECATIWSADHQTIEHLKSLTDEEFLHSLQQEFGYRLGRLQGIRKRHVFPLRMVRAEKTIDQSVFLLGNSAHTLHPIAAQGFNLAIYEVAALIECIFAKLEKNEKFTAADLHQVSNDIMKHQAKSIGISQGLAKLFTRDSIWLDILLQTGMTVFDMLTPAKQKFINDIMGRSGRMPNLLMSGIT